MIKKALKLTLVLFATFSMTNAYAGYKLFACQDLNKRNPKKEYGCFESGGDCIMRADCGDVDMNGNPINLGPSIVG